MGSAAVIEMQHLYTCAMVAATAETSIVHLGASHLALCVEELKYESGLCRRR